MTRLRTLVVSAVLCSAAWTAAAQQPASVTALPPAWVPPPAPQYAAEGAARGLAQRGGVHRRQTREEAHAGPCP